MSSTTPANDTPELTAVYQTASGAESAALRLALRNSPTRRARTVAYVSGLVTADEGGPAYGVRILVEGYAVREVPAEQVDRIQQSAIRERVARHLENAAAHEVKAKELSPKWAGYRRDMATMEREQARKLETLLTVARAS